MCFLVVINPFLILVDKYMWSCIAPKSACLAVTLILSLEFSACCLLVFMPGIFKFTAITVSIGILIFKVVAVFVHTPYMKSASCMLAELESTYESAIQLFLLLHMWLSTGKLHSGTMLSSVLIIGKVAAENYLVKGQENLMKNKTILERIFLIGKYIPVMCLTTIFRIGSIVLFMFPPSLVLPLQPFPCYLFLDLYFFSYQIFFLLVLNTLKPFNTDLRMLTAFEMFDAINGELVTITMWPKAQLLTS